MILNKDYIMTTFAFLIISIIVGVLIINKVCDKE